MMTLLGWHCLDCSRVSFPAEGACVLCGSPHGQSRPLPTRGTVVSLSRVGQRQVCEVRLDGSLLIMGSLPDDQPAVVGSRVALSTFDTAPRFILDAS